jgi:hypothetical protein
MQDTSTDRASGVDNDNASKGITKKDTLETAKEDSGSDSHEAVKWNDVVVAPILVEVSWGLLYCMFLPVVCIRGSSAQVGRTF